MLQESSSRAPGNGAVKIFFLTPNRSMFAGKFVNWESFLAVFREHIIFNVKRVEVRKMSEAFLSEDLLRNEWPFSLAFIGFLLENLELKKTLMMSSGTCRKKLYAWKNILKNRITNMRFWIIYILVQFSFFGGLV